MRPNLSIVIDLPPFWDGRAVVWRGWERQPVLLCRLPDDSCCTRCGSKENASINFGLVADDTEMTHAQIRQNDDLVSHKHRKYGVKRKAWLSLQAFRCPDCGHDTVRDENGDWWDLDESDYGPQGSLPAPSGRLFDDDWSGL